MAQSKVRVGNIEKISGKVTIAGGDIGFTAEEVSALLTQITSTFHVKKFDGRCPYKGLDVFEEEDVKLFFGREKLVAELVERVKVARTVFITGPSGSGKSSLVRAGLIPVLKQGAIKNSQRWQYEIIKPGRDPLEALASAFSRLKSPELGKYFRENFNQPDALHECAESVLSGRKDQRLVLFIDQFEEVFTQVGKDKAEPFLNSLTQAATVENGRVILLFAMRSDFVSNCATYLQLNELLNRQFIQIGAMQPDELVSAIAQPALRVGLRIDSDLIAQIITDMQGEPGALPLMQFTLKDLFDSQETKGGVIALTLADYLQRGGIHKALERHADNAFSKLSVSEQELARTIFTGLIEIGRGRQDTRRTALFTELIPADHKAEDLNSIVQKLADARLIITDEQAGVDTVMISHEKLIDAWPWLKKLINENREVIALQNEIANDAKEWNDNRRDKSYLYTGSRLVKARKHIATKNILLTGMAQEFIKAGKSQQRISRTPALALSILGLCLIAAFFSYYHDRTILVRQQVYIGDFYAAYNGNSPTLELSALANIYRLKGILLDIDSDATATGLFYSMYVDEQLSLFNDLEITGNSDWDKDLTIVVKHLYMTLANTNLENDNTELLLAMENALKQADDHSAALLEHEIHYWLTGRINYREGNFEGALDQYSRAIDMNSENPATHFERAKVHISVRDYEHALYDLNSTMSISLSSFPSELHTTTTINRQELRERFRPVFATFSDVNAAVESLIARSQGLQNALRARPENYPVLLYFPY